MGLEGRVAFVSGGFPGSEPPVTSVAGVRLPGELLVAVIGRLVSGVSDRFALFLPDLPLVGRGVAFVGRPVTCVGEAVAAVGRSVAFVGLVFPLGPVGAARRGHDRVPTGRVAPEPAWGTVL